jgi:hypothetical protein
MEEGAKAREGKGKKNKTAKEEWRGGGKKVGRTAAGGKCKNKNNYKRNASNVEDKKDTA